MQNHEILRKAIEKAGNNGYHLRSSTNFEWIQAHYALEEIIFDHSFARAYWGDFDPECQRLGSTKEECNEWHEPYWKHQLQELVLAEDRLGYIEKFLD